MQSCNDTNKDLIKRLNESKSIFQIIDSYYNDRIEINAIKWDNKYNNRIVRKQLFDLHQKIREIEFIGELKRNNYNKGSKNTKRPHKRHDQSKDGSKDTDYITYSEEELITEVGLMDKIHDMNSTQPLIMKNKDKLLNPDITWETVENNNPYKIDFYNNMSQEIKLKSKEADELSKVDELIKESLEVIPEIHINDLNNHIRFE